MEHDRVHNVAPGDAALSTLPGRIEAKVSGARSFSAVLYQAALGLPGGCFHTWLGRMFKAAQIAMLQKYE